MRTKLAIALIVSVILPALAQVQGYEIMTSNVAAYPVGTVLSASDRIVLPEGAQLTLLYRKGEAAETRQCGGRYEGPIEACKASGGAARSPMIGGGMRGSPKKE